MYWLLTNQPTNKLANWLTDWLTDWLDLPNDANFTHIFLTLSRATYPITSQQLFTPTNEANRQSSKHHLVLLVLSCLVFVSSCFVLFVYFSLAMSCAINWVNECDNCANGMSQKVSELCQWKLKQITRQYYTVNKSMRIDGTLYKISRLYPKSLENNPILCGWKPQRSVDQN